MNDIDTRNPSVGRVFRRALLVGVSTIAACSFPAAAFAQEQSASPEVAPEDNAPNTATADQTGGGTAANTGQVGPAAASVEGNEIVVTGVRASLQRARDIKRTSSGVVDAVSAEEIGKFPDTNLAESLQRIPGVSIERRNGEGRGVTVRGFGPAFNMVTVNGRQLAASSIDAVGGDLAVDFSRATSRAFDFSNLASEGVSRLEVYKTGRAAIPSGGIGASINVVTTRPLEGRESGLRGSVGAKALYDTSLDGFEVTPELTGVVSWSDPSDTLGVSVFAAYQRRKSAAASSTVNGWTVTTFDDMGAVDRDGLNNNDTTFENAPPGDQLVARPDDSRYHYSESDRKRLNLAGTVQFRPMETLTLTADGLYARQRLSEDRSDQTNWFATPYDHVVFDDDDVVATPIFIEEGTRYGQKDIGFEQQRRATKNVLKSFGLNANWEISPGFTLNLDGNTSKSRSTPDNPNGTSSTLVGMGAPVVAGHSVDFSGDIPQQSWDFDDSTGNDNGVFDLGDLGTQIARTNTSRQSHRINQFRADLGWDFGAGARFDIGASRSNSKMISARQQTQQRLGDWGISNVGDVELLASDLVDQFCLGCQFGDFNATNADIAFRGNAVDLYNTLSAAYLLDADPTTPGLQDCDTDTAGQQGCIVRLTGNEYDRVKERITSLYAQMSWKGDFAGRPAAVVGGLRWETTKVDAFGLAPLPSIVWLSDNDFRRDVDVSQTFAYSGKGKYSNFLPSIDFRLEPMENLVARVSLSKTLARAEYDNMFVSPAVNSPARPGALGGQATGMQGNPSLKPLVSGNLDISLEYYYARSSYVSAGFFAKNVKNFLGTGTYDSPLFDLRDPSAGVPGSRSGIALQELQDIGQTVDELNLFTMTALLIQNGGDIDAASAIYQANIDPNTGGVALDFAEDVFAAVDITGDANDPLFNFAITRPVNTRRGKIHGLELQGQHFFGDSGFGVAASLTKVFGDVKFDRGSNPNENVFALLGLSDSANVTAMFEKYGFSARVAYNWRGRFLSQLNRGGSRNPVYFEPYGTVDASLGYDINDRLALSLEGINLLGEDVRTYGRSQRQLWFAQEGHPRFLFGARYRFGGGAPVVAAPAPVYTPPPPAPATQTCADGSVILATDACPVVAPPPPPAPAPAGERG